ncbi:MAG: hypothetical protein WDO68_29690 [Gammaproteobacteria bacterium]
MFAARYSRELRLAALAVCVLLAACVAHSESRGRNDKSEKNVPTPPAPTLLTFNWGRQLDARVFAIREEFSFKGDSERVSRLEAEFQLHAERQGDRYVLTFSELSMKLDNKPIPEEAQPSMIGPITGLVLNYDIAANGDFIGHRDLGSLQSFTERSYLGQNANLPPEKRPSQRNEEQAMKSGSSREVLQVEASRTWGALVGMWAGVTMTEGKPLSSDSSVTIPVINLPLAVHSKFELIRSEECARGERKKACVRLRATSRPDATQLAVAAQRLKESTGGRAEPLSMSALQVEDRYELLTDAETLKPRWAEWVRGTDVEGTEQGSNLLDSRQSTRTRMIFVYK